MFHMSRETINALKKYLKIFEEKGLRKIRVKKVAVAEKEVVAVCSRLQEAKALPDETVVDVLTGLTLCSVPEFTKMFDFALQRKRMEALELADETEQDTLKEIKAIMSKAVDSYHSLCMAGKWFLANKSTFLVTCWNCGKKGHGAGNCQGHWSNRLDRVGGVHDCSNYRI